MKDLGNTDLIAIPYASCLVSSHDQGSDPDRKNKFPLEIQVSKSFKHFLAVLCQRSCRIIPSSHKPVTSTGFRRQDYEYHSQGT